jgi:SNF2 family DNA or RNA helicase
MDKHIILPEDCIFTKDLENFTKSSDKYITLLINFSDLKNLEKNKNVMNNKFDRIIIDEYHELSASHTELYDIAIKIPSKHKWAVTATPFVNKEMINNIINFIAKTKIQSKNISKYKMYINTFSDMFRKNTKKTIEKEFKLPKIKEISYYLNFSDKERLYYDTLISNDKTKLEQMKRYFCINPSLLSLKLRPWLFKKPSNPDF